MRANLLVTLLAAGLAGASVQPSAEAQDAAASGESVQVTAHVRDAETGEPLAGAVVALSGVQVRQVTDVGGTASFGAAVGEYELVVSRSGYETLRGDFSVLRPGDFFLQMVRADLDDPAAAARLVVKVADAETTRPIEGAAVSLLSGAARPTDVWGNAAFAELPPVLTQVTVEMIGYASRTEPVALQPGRTTSVEMRMAVKAIEMEPIVVEVRSPLMEAHGVYDRLQRGIANRVVTREAIERQASHRLSDALAYVPGLNVRREGGSIGLPTRAVVYARGCPVTVWVDGVRWNADIEGSVDIDQISPEWIELAEVYSGARTPIQFSAGSDCGAVLLWTRHGSRR